MTKRTTASKGVPHRWFYVLSLHLSGKTAQEISDLTDYSLFHVYAILKREEVVTLRQQILSGVSDEFEALQSKVVSTVRDALDHKEVKIRLQAADMWMKAHGKYKGEEQKNVNITAEDCVIQILQNGVPSQACPAYDTQPTTTLKQDFIDVE